MTHLTSIARAHPRPVAAANSTRAVRTMAVRRRKGGLTIEQTNALIENVQKCPCIWNPDHEEYVYRSKIAISWVEIAKEMKLPENVLRAKWKNLRDLFIREVKRLYVTSIDSYGGKWRHFQKLWFLYRPDMAIDISDRQRSEDEASEITDAYEPHNEPYLVKIEPPDTDVSEFTYLETQQEVNEILPEKRKLTDKNSKSDRDDDSDVFLEALKRKRQKAYTDEDCDMMFLMSLTPYFKLLKPVRKLVVRNKIQEILLKEIERSANGQL